MSKKILSLFIAVLLAVPFAAFGTVGAQAKAWENHYTVAVNGFDCSTSSGGVFVYPNTGSSEKSIDATTYGFNSTSLLVFDKDGMLIEAGGNIYIDQNNFYGAPQRSVKVPAGGFLIAYTNNTTLGKVKTLAMEGAMLYNATMSVIYPVYATFDKSAKTVDVYYDNAKTPSATAKRFLFVGNSTTYFNGIPIKFKGLCEAAGIDVIVDYCTFGSAYLSEFADPNKVRTDGYKPGKSLRDKLAANKYDYVFLQDASGAAYGDMLAALKVLVPLVQENGAKPILYMRYGTGIDRQVYHHENYTKLAQYFGIGCAPSADGYKVCLEKYPSIKLMADDNGHHSKEGSYLIAATWFEYIFGKDVRDNSYGAQLNADTVKKLKECAHEAVANYDPDSEIYEDSNYVIIDGQKYGYVSQGAKYTVTGSIYTDTNMKWTDATSATDGTPRGKLTDGIFAASAEENAIGCWSGIKQADGTFVQTVTMDLGATKSLKHFRTDLWGGTWGIADPSPATVSVAVSSDGKTFTDLGKLTQSNADSGSTSWIKKMYNKTLDEAVDAKFVKFTYTLAGAKFCWTSEAAVFGGDSQGEEEQYKLGDVNDNGKVDANDYLLLKRHVLKTFTLSEKQQKPADVDKNGKIDSKDYLLVKRAVLGTYTLEV